jgi:ABC-type branched-subunit amino acid transport system ATPase component/nitrogen-specific signal transduction histidine kinase
MSSNNSGENILELRNLSVRFKSKTILDTINLDVKRGDIHAVVGSHGCGKSTLVKVISGIIGHDSGTIIFNGMPVDKLNAEKAIDLGISTLHQTISLVQNLSVLKNIFLNRELRKYFIFADKKKMKEKALEVFKHIPLKINPDDKVFFYKFTDQQWIEIAKLFCYHSKLIVIDEVSNRLDKKNLEIFHHLLSLLRNEGSTILYFTDDFNQISNFASSVSIINEGRIQNTVNISNIDKLKLVQLTYASLASRAQLENYNMDLIYANHIKKYALDNIPLPIFITDSRDNVVLINKMIENIFYINRFDLINNNIELMKSILLSKSKKNNISLSSIPFYDEDNAFLGNLNIINNKDDSLTESISDYLKKIPLKNRLSGIAHEINNPLGTIQNYVRIVQGSKSVDFIQKNMKIIDSELKRIKRIIKRNLNEQSDIKAEDIGEGKKSLKDIIDNILLILHLEIEKNHINIIKNYNENNPIALDADHITQILLNIILNGIEAMPKGGTLSIETTNSENNTTIYKIVKIKDTGNGIPENIKDEIFKPFFTTKKGDEARGLGLSLCRDLIGRIGGSVELDENGAHDHGASFVIRFPLSRRGKVGQLSNIYPLISENY